MEISVGDSCDYMTHGAEALITALYERDKDSNPVYRSLGWSQRRILNFCEGFIMTYQDGWCMSPMERHVPPQGRARVEGSMASWAIQVHSSDRQESGQKG